MGKGMVYQKQGSLFPDFFLGDNDLNSEESRILTLDGQNRQSPIATLRAQRSKIVMILKFSSEIEIFKRDWIFFQFLALRVAFSERGQLSQAIPQFHTERMLNEWTPIGAIRIAAQRTQGLWRLVSMFLGGDMTANER